MSYIKAGQHIFNLIILSIIVYALIIYIFDIDDEPIRSAISSMLQFCWDNVLWSIVGFVGVGALGAYMQDQETKEEFSQKTINRIAILLGFAALAIVLLLLGAIIHLSIVIMDGRIGEILSNFSFLSSLITPLLIALVLALLAKTFR